MNYNAMIQNRKSVRAFRDTPVSAAVLEQVKACYAKDCRRLIPEIDTELVVLGTDARQALEGTAGYKEFLIGAPNYLVLLSAPHAHAVENGAYMMEDMVLRMADMGLDSCWITFTDSDKVKAALSLTSDKDVVAVAAFGLGQKTAKKMRLNILSMSNVDVKAQRQYYAPKKSIYDLVSVDQWGNTDGLDELMGFYDDMLWQSFYAVAQSPSYLNRQPYGLVLRGHDLVLLSLADEYTDERSARQGLGIVMLHFAAVAQQWVGKVNWDLDAAVDMPLPAGASVAAVYHM